MSGWAGQAGQVEKMGKVGKVQLPISFDRSIYLQGCDNSKSLRGRYARSHQGSSGFPFCSSKPFSIKSYFSRFISDFFPIYSLFFARYLHLAGVISSYRESRISPKIESC